jgi:hypothetical protein
LIATSVNTASVRDALGRLGLHDQRRMETAADPREYGVMISAFELVKLADRAEHLVVLERLMQRLSLKGPGGSVYMFADAVENVPEVSRQLARWLEVHDFSMLESGE